MASYDMTIGTGAGWGGGSGLGGWLGSLGNNLIPNLYNNLGMATAMYDFNARQLVQPSQVNAAIGANNVAQQQNQMAYQDLFTANQMWGLNNTIGSGQTANTLANRNQTAPTNQQPHAVLNQNTQVQTHNVNNAPSKTGSTPYSQNAGLDGYYYDPSTGQMRVGAFMRSPGG